MRSTEADPSGHVLSEPPWPSPLYSWYVVGVLLLAYTCSFIDRMILTLLVGPIRADLGISDTQMSLLVGFAFAVLYTFAGIPLGYVADRWNRSRLIGLGISGWSVMTVLCGLAPTYAWLFLARVGVGVGEATLSPAAYSLMSDYFPKHKLGRAIAVYSIGVPLGSGIALIIGGYIVQIATSMPPIDLPGIGSAAAWRIVFFMVGVPGLLIALLMLTVKEPVRRDVGRRADSGIRIRDAFAFVIAERRTFGPHFIGLSLLTLVIYGNMAWIPTFFARTYGMAAATAGLYFGVILAVGGALGLLAGGAMADRLFRTGHKDGHLRTVIFATLGAAPFLIAGPLMPSPALAFACIALAMLIATMHGGVAGAALQIVTPNRFRGQITAIYFFVANLVGFGLGPTVVALITDYGFGNDAALRYSLAIVAAAVLPISAMVVASGLRAFRQRVEALEASAR